MNATQTHYVCRVMVSVLSSSPIDCEFQSRLVQPIKLLNWNVLLLC